MSDTGTTLDPTKFVQPGRRLLIDTNIFMDTDQTRSDSRKRLFERCQVDILQHKNPIVVPSKVIEELTKQSRLEPSGLSEERQAAVRKAANALVFLRSVEPEGLVRLDLGDASNPYADDLFVELFTRASETYDLCLLTYDTTLRLRIRLLAATSGRNVVTGTLNADGMIEVEGDQALFERGLRKLAKQRHLVESGPDAAKAEREIASLEPLLAEVQATLGLRTPPPRRPRTTFAKSAGFKGADRTLSPVDIPGQGSTVHYADAAGRGSLTVGVQIGEGGEGRVYEVAEHPDRVVKIFDAEHRTEHRLRKLTSLVAMGLKLDGIGFPTDLLTDANGAFVGYAMPRASGRELQATVMRPKRFTETYPNWTKADLVDVCISFLEKVAYLHSLNILLGDINPKNLLVDASKSVWIIDADSWQLDGYPCPVGTAMFTAPTLKGDYSDRLRTNQEELFAVATMLFMVLITGQFPYARARTDGDITQLIVEGKFAFQFQGTSEQDQPDGNWKYMWSHLPVKVKRLFWNTFHRDGQRYSRRPTAVEWLAVFQEYRESFGGPQDFDPMSNDVYPTRFKAFRPDTVIKACPICMRPHAIVGEWDDETQGYTVPDRCFQCSRSRPASPPTLGTCRSCDRQFAKSSLVYGRCADCTEKANQLDPSRLCADCRQPFITFGNVDWYGKRGLIVPRRHQSIKETCPPSRAGTTRPSATRPARTPTVPVATKPAREGLLTRIIKSLFS